MKLKRSAVHFTSIPLAVVLIALAGCATTSSAPYSEQAEAEREAAEAAMRARAYGDRHVAAKEGQD